MKKAVVWVLGALLSITVTTNDVQAQIRKVPAAVTDAFKAKYPSADEVEYKDRLSFFLIDFEMDDVSYQARFSSKGEWMQTEKAIDEEDLPAAVQDGFEKSKYSDWEITETAEVEYSDEHIEYKISIKRSSIEKKYLFFNEKGKLLRDLITL